MRFKATPHNGARRFGARFWHKRKYEKCGNTGCISHFSYCTIGAKAPPKPAAPIVRCCLKLPKSMLSGFQTIAGTALTAVAFGLFIIPQGFAAGGITGLARILSDVLPVPLSVLVYLITIPVFIIGWLTMGWFFVGKTLIVSLLFPAFLEVSSHFSIPGLGMGGNTLLAGLLLRFGSVLVLRRNASSGGFDTLAVALNRKHGTPVALVVRICDCTVIFLQTLGQSLTNTVAGIVVILINTAVINFFMGKTPQRDSAFTRNRRTAKTSASPN